MWVTSGNWVVLFPKMLTYLHFDIKEETYRKICVSRVWLRLFWKWETLWVSLGRMRENSNNKKQSKEGLACWALGTAEAEEKTFVALGVLEKGSCDGPR